MLSKKTIKTRLLRDMRKQQRPVRSHKEQSVRPPVRQRRGASLKIGVFDGAKAARRARQGRIAKRLGLSIEQYTNRYGDLDYGEWITSHPDMLTKTKKKPGPKPGKKAAQRAAQALAETAIQSSETTDACDICGGFLSKAATEGVCRDCRLVVALEIAATSLNDLLALATASMRPQVNAENEQIQAMIDATVNAKLLTLVEASQSERPPHVGGSAPVPVISTTVIPTQVISPEVIRASVVSGIPENGASEEVNAMAALKSATL